MSISATQTIQFREKEGVRQSPSSSTRPAMRPSGDPRQWLQEHDSTLKPSESIQALREAKERSLHHYYAKGGTSPRLRW